MKKNLLIILYFLNLSCKDDQCQNYNNDFLPKNIIESIDYLECKLNSSELESFKNTPEEDIIGKYHFTLGKYIRNEWEIWNGDTKLFVYFKEKGVSNPDKISSIILTSLHRKLNKKNIGFQEQISDYLNLIEKSKVEFENSRLNSEEYYATFKVGDSVEFGFEVDYNNDKKIVILKKNYSEYHHPYSCKAKGIIVNKDGLDTIFGYKISVSVHEFCNYLNLKNEDKLFNKGDTIKFYIERQNLKAITNHVDNSNK
ncbi:DUF6794 domain-containing protein [Flavobacterium tibetense]|uniref:DUF6794 domain-containing protein n=1 Tax=Flavobacterium tibetense TaxID=2233533 RepID=A0A365P180_9FLAO|nr:DUF6794 domain-containing protein [Flavobacterium tibetense]RBA28220.1 hypothetical protein DPN68_08705 [Flavobacterium tibetense]